MIPLEVREEAGSTSALLWERYDGGDRRAAALFAGRQTSGRGTWGRNWFSPPSGSFHLSVLFTLPATNRERLPHLPLQAALLMVHLLADYTDQTIGIKLPNDLQVGSRKLGGVLVESRIADSGPVPVVVGIGLNLNVHLADFPEELRGSVVSLGELTGLRYPELEIARAYIDLVEREMAS